jgi:hypothetical protein
MILEYILNIITFIMGIIVFCKGIKYMKEDLMLFYPSVGLLILGSFFIVFSIISSFNIEKPINFKPLYQIDPKQDSYIILNGEQYDTVPHGKLEEYIQNDNL